MIFRRKVHKTEAPHCTVSTVKSDCGSKSASLEFLSKSSCALRERSTESS